MSNPMPSPSFINEEECNKVIQELFKSGDISSDGEFSEIARKEISRMNYSMDDATAVVQKNLSIWMTQHPPDSLMLPPAFEDFPISIIESEPTGINPCIEEVGGIHNFQVKVPIGIKSGAKEAHYSEQLRKLYINQNRFVNLEFRMEPLPETESKHFFVRAICIFIGADDYAEPVTVCYTHSRDSVGHAKSTVADHLVRCNHTKSIYQLDSVSGRHSVMAPMSTSGSGCLLGYKFMDLGSCCGGINRRETALIFTLEDVDGNVLGRRVLQLRICTAPKRDLDQDEKKYDKNAAKTVLNMPPAPKLGAKKEAFWVLAHGKENFEILKTVGEALEKKDGGSTVIWNESVKRHNKNMKERLPKKKKKTDGQ